MCAGVAEDARERQYNDLEVEGQRPIPDVVGIQTLLLPFLAITLCLHDPDCTRDTDSLRTSVGRECLAYRLGDARTHGGVSIC